MQGHSITFNNLLTNELIAVSTALANCRIEEISGAPAPTTDDSDLFMGTINNDEAELIVPMPPVTDQAFEAQVRNADEKGLILPTVTPPAQQTVTTTIAVTQPSPTLDKSGLPWDARINSTPPKFKSNGQWKRRRNIDDQTFNAVTQELNAVMGIQGKGEVTPPPPVAAPLFPPAAAAPPPPIAPVEPVEPENTPFALLCERVRIANKNVLFDATLNKFGFASRSALSQAGPESLLFIESQVFPPVDPVAPVISSPPHVTPPVITAPIA